MSQPCTLCALDVGRQPLPLQVAGQTLLFCCEGCRGIYMMLHDLPDSAALAAVPNSQEARKETP